MKFSSTCSTRSSPPPSFPHLQHSARIGTDKTARGWLARSLGMGADGLNGLGLDTADISDHLVSACWSGRGEVGGAASCVWFAAGSVVGGNTKELIQYVLDVHLVPSTPAGGCPPHHPGWHHQAAVVRQRRRPRAGGLCCQSGRPPRCPGPPTGQVPGRWVASGSAAAAWLVMQADLWISPVQQAAALPTCLRMCRNPAHSCPAPCRND